MNLQKKKIFYNFTMLFLKKSSSSRSHISDFVFISSFDSKYCLTKFLFYIKFYLFFLTKTSKRFRSPLLTFQFFFFFLVTKMFQFTNFKKNLYFIKIFFLNIINGLIYHFLLKFRYPLIAYKHIFYK